MALIQPLCVADPNQGKLVPFEALKAVLEKTLTLSCKDHIADEMENALTAYGKVAFKRVMDNVPMACESVLKSILPKVQNKFKTFTDRELASLLAESQVIVLKRKNLKEKIQGLEEAEQAIEKILGFH